MRLFVSEFLSGGGLCGENLPPDLLRDADCMSNALMDDLRRIDGLELITTRDVRLGSIPESVAVIRTADDPWVIWAECLRSCDAAWITAPESGGILLALRHLADVCGCRFIGSDAEAIRITTSKTATMQYFSRAGIAGIETAAVSGSPPHGEHGWIVKRDDGAGCENTWYFSDQADIIDWRSACADAELYIVQPRINGRHASLSVLYSDNGCRVLACNEQDIRFENGRVHAKEPYVDKLHERIADLVSFAESIGRAMPGLRGFVGIDFMYTDTGPVLVEINPRLTTSYAGLHAILDYNPAERILQSFGYLTESTDPVTL
ncbi:MAG: ATP-grasp domain-containing protein [Gammaproteobacteria bacterium]